MLPYSDFSIVRTPAYFRVQIREEGSFVSVDVQEGATDEYEKRRHVLRIDALHPTPTQ